MDDRSIAAYLDRIGARAPEAADRRALADLQLRHLLAVPFENLSIHLGEAIVLDEAALLDKLVRRRRGGFCYELNGLFAALLSALGYRVTLLAARVYGGPERALGPPFDHLVLRVDLDGPWLVDVGFGRFSHAPLRLDPVAGEQRDADGVYRVVDAGHGDLDVVRDGESQYRVEARPRALVDFEPTCWWHATSPRSHFTRSLVCSRLTEAGRVTLSGRALVETTAAGRREQVLGADADVLAAYTSWFGVALDRVPEVRPPAQADPSRS